jgi:hypothetical protein
MRENEMSATATTRRTILRSAYTIEPTNRIVLDGDAVTVTDVQRNYNAKTVTLTTSYGAPRTVTFDAAVPLVLCPHTFADGVQCVFRAGHGDQVGGTHHWPPVIDEGWAAGSTDGPNGEWLTVHGSFYGPRSAGRIYATREAAEQRAADIRSRSVPSEAERVVVRRVRDMGGAFRILAEV